MSATMTSGEATARTLGTTPRLRLTRRGRAVVGTLVAAAVIGLLAFAATLGATRAEASTEAGQQVFGYVVVEPGESLWSVATELDSARDPRDVIAEIVRLNQLEGSAIQAGQPIAVPLEYANAPGVFSGEDLGIEAA